MGAVIGEEHHFPWSYRLGTRQLMSVDFEIFVGLFGPGCVGADSLNKVLDSATTKIVEKAGEKPVPVEDPENDYQVVNFGDNPHISKYPIYYVIIVILTYY